MSNDSYYCSMEQIYTPAYIGREPDPAHVGIKPCFQAPTENYSSGFPTAQSMNPYFLFAESDFNHSIINDGATGDLSIKKLEVRMESVQTMGFRGPMIMSGWGYGADMKCIPFEFTEDVDPLDEDEVYDSTDVHVHHTDTGTNRNLWKTGPIDLRWDEERKVWGPGFDFVEGYLTTAMTVATSKTKPTSFEMTVHRNEDTNLEEFGLESNLEDIKWIAQEDTITGINRSTQLNGKVGAYVILMRINYEWRPIYLDNC